MNILILSSSNPYKTSGVIAHDIYTALKERNCNNDIKVVTQLYCNNTDANVISLTTKYGNIKKRILNKISNVMKRLSKTNNRSIINKYVIQDFDQTIMYRSTKQILKIVRSKPDVILILFPQHFLMPRDILELYKRTNAPIMLYLLDMAFITGGCHYAWECIGYKSRCGSCPAMYSSTENDQSRRNWEVKYNSFRKANIEIIAPTKQLYEQVKSSPIFYNKKIHHILLPISNDLFKTGSMKKAREILNLPQGKFIFMVGSVRFSKRKGYKQLFESLKILRNTGKHIDLEKVHIIVAGSLDNIKPELMQFDFTKVGYLSYEKLAIAFQASNLFISASIQDSGPMMVNQAMMCGTPVVAFKIGVALDLVKDGESGFTCDLGDTSKFAQCLNKILTMDREEYLLLRKNTLQFAKSMTQKDVVAKQLEEVILRSQ